MPALRVMVRPMNDTAFFVPDILAVEANLVAFFDSIDSLCNVDVVCKQECLSWRKLNDESLVSRAVHIVWEDATYRSLAFDLHAACSTRERAANRVVITTRGATPFSARTRTQDKECFVRASSD